MKKLTVLGVMLFALGTTTLAKGHHHNNVCNYHSNCPAVCVANNQNTRTVKKARRVTPEMEKSRLIIDEKNLEIRKELIKDTPDWKKIERLNNEIATEQSRRKTANMKSRFEARQKIEQQVQQAKKTN